VVIDPDLIDLDNVRIAVATNTVPQLLANRQAEVQGFFNAVKKLRESKPAPLAGFDAVIADTLPGTDLVALDQQQWSGVDIEPALNGLKLSRAAFARLVRVRALAQRGNVTDEEWDDVYHILTQVKKSRRFEAWRLEEQPIGLTPDHFRVSDIDPPLLPWRSSPLARQAWQDTLQARIDQ
jgi:hypothetical protein